MGERPGLDGDEEGMLQLRLDLPRNIGRHEKDEGRQHQHDRHPARPCRRRPDLDDGRLGKAVDEQDEAGDRQQREQDLVAVFAYPADQPVAQAGNRRQCVDAEKDDDADDEECHACSSLVPIPDDSASPLGLGGTLLRRPSRRFGVALAEKALDPLIYDRGTFCFVPKRDIRSAGRSSGIGVDECTELHAQLRVGTRVA